MPNSVECLAYIAKYDTHLFASVNGIAKDLVDMKYLICCGMKMDAGWVGTYRKCEQRRFKRVLAIEQFCQTYRWSQKVEM